MKNRSLWAALLAFFSGLIFIAAAITLVICTNADFMQFLLFVLIAVGGAFLSMFGWNSYKLHQQTSEDPSKLPAKMRTEAEERLKAAQDQSGKLSAKMLTCLILTIAACVFVAFYGIAQNVDPVPKSNALQYLSYETAEVIEITSEDYRGNQQMEDRPEGNQMMTVKITTGEHKGETYVNVRNYLSIYKGTVLKAGDSVIVSISDDGQTVEFQGVYDYNRITPLLIILLVFILATILVGGKVGAKSLIGLGLTVVGVFTILFPLLIGGWPTLPTVLGLCAYVTIVEFVIIGGVNKKILCAIVGTISGVAIAMLFGELSANVLRLTGYQMNDAVGEVEALGQLRQTQAVNHQIQISDLLVGGILIAALGAVNDVAMSISSAMNELVAVNPNLTRKELFKSGMTIGRDMVGTMTNTLILALVGGSFVEILYYSSLDLSFYELMSTTYFPIEIMQAVASSLGVILAVPLSVVCAILFFAKPKHS